MLINADYTCKVTSLNSLHRRWNWTQPTPWSPEVFEYQRDDPKSLIGVLVTYLFYLILICFKDTQPRTRRVGLIYMIGRWRRRFLHEKNIYFFPPDPHELFRPEVGQPFHRWTVGRDFCTGNSKTNQGSMSPFKFDSDIVKYFSFIQKLCPPWRWKSACSRRLSWLWTAWPIGSEHCGGEHGVRFWLVETKLQVFDLTTMSWSETGSLPEGMDGNALLAIERGPWAGQVPHNGFREWRWEFNQVLSC